MRWNINGYLDKVFFTDESQGFFGRKTEDLHITMLDEAPSHRMCVPSGTKKGQCYHFFMHNLV